MPDRNGAVVVAGTGFPSLATERATLGLLGYSLIDGNMLSEPELAEACRTAVAVLTDYFRCDAVRVAQLDRCQVICQYGVGYDMIDVDAATAAGIYVTCTPDYCVEELADHTMALLLSVARRVVHYDRLVKSGRWDYNDGMPIRRLSSCTLGLLGFGRAARAVAERARGFGLRVVAHDPLVGPDTFRAADVTENSLNELLREADILSLHVPLTAETRHLIGAKELAQLRDGAIVVNTARGGVIDQVALRAELTSGRIAGAALDVLEEEPPPPDDPLLDCQNIVLTPHAGFLSIESLESVQQQAAEEVARVLNGDQPLFGVNVDRIRASKDESQARPSPCDRPEPKGR